MKHQFITSISQIKIAQVAKWLKLIEGFTDQKYQDLFNNLEFRAQVVAIMLEMPLVKVKSHIDIDSVLEISEHYISLFNTYRYNEPKELVEVNGQKFRFSKNTGGWSTGQIIDAKLVSVEDLIERPERMLAILYVEDGLKYFQTDDSQQVINPNERRERLFKEHFNGEEFWNFYNFFLSNCESWKLAISGIQIARMRIAAKKTAKNLKKRQRELKMRGFISRLQWWKSPKN